MEQLIVDSYVRMQSSPLYLRNVNAVKEHSSHRPRFGWLDRLVSILFGSVMRALVDNAFNRGGLKVWRRIVQERVGAVEGTTGHMCLANEVCHSFVTIVFPIPCASYPCWIMLRAWITLVAW